MRVDTRVQYRGPRRVADSIAPLLAPAMHWPAVLPRHTAPGALTRELHCFKHCLVRCSSQLASQCSSRVCAVRASVQFADADDSLSSLLTPVHTHPPVHSPPGAPSLPPPPAPQFADSFASPTDPERVALWALVKFDLDWLAQVKEEPLESR